MNAFLLPHIQARISSSSSSTSTTDKKEKNQFLRLTVNSIKDEESSSGGPIDHASFIANASGQIKVFLFAGHDTTASTLCWVFHCLLRNPQSLSKLRSELTAVLGPGPAAPALRANPHLVNALTYTTAVVKETLRLQTNVGTMRQGGRGFDLVGPEGSEFAGARFPTEGCVLWDGNWAIHRDPALWARADEFVPERWLCADEGDPLHPVRNAYRPFELGPRDCIGQHLAMVEMKLVLALVVREFDIMEDWEAWDEVR
jgi:cytochrome P450